MGLLRSDRGTHLIRSYRFFNNATACDDGWPFYDYACAGAACQVCLNPNAGNANAVDDKIFLHRNVTPEWEAGATTATHEFLHVQGGLQNMNWGDEYASGSRRTCGHSWMGVYDDNQFTACSPLTHRATGIDWRPTRRRTHRSTIQIAADGTNFSHPDARSNWQEWQDEGRLVAPYPSYQTPPVLRMRSFRTYNYLGFYNQLQ